jgi:hypothetical protein
MNRSLLACWLFAALTMSACTAASPVSVPGAILDNPLQLTVTPPVGDGRVRLSVATTVAGAASYRFFRRNGPNDEELPVSPVGERDFLWESRGLSPGVYTLWASAYTSAGRLLVSSALTPLVLTPATAATLPPLRGVVRDAP